MTPAALDGIAVNGLRWKHSIRLRDVMEPMKDADALKTGDVGRILDLVAKRVKAFASLPKVAGDTDLSYRLSNAVDDLETCDDCPEEARHVLNDLFDVFDFHRVLVQ